MNGTEDMIAAEAAAWHLAIEDPDIDWDAFTRWLEGDRRHRIAFDEVALADAMLVEHRDALGAAFAANDDNADDEPERPFLRRWIGWSVTGLAASLAAILAFQQFTPDRPDRNAYETGAQSRSIALADGSRIELAPSSRLEIADGGHRMMLKGGAWFEIRHDPSRELSIQAGGVEISDIGTKFDVQAAGGQVRVEVAEGRVNVSSDAMENSVKLVQGRGLTFDPSGGTATLSDLADGNVGEWRSGRLTFEAAPLTLVAADLSRYAGVKITLADKLGERRFTGTLVTGDGEAALRDLSQLMDLELGRDGAGYRLRPRSR